LVKSRLLPILNAVGCLALTGLVISQWQQDRHQQRVLQQLRSAAVTNAQQLATEVAHSETLGRDIAVLKQSITATQTAAESAAHQLAEQNLQAGDFKSQLTAASEQVELWKTALAERDRKLIEQSNELLATRKRLDEAIAKLNALKAR
jgi:predicted regulator of Ras-like GTPase activity (Roadblock/LC7/MglB family)